ncbi:MAG TPA: nucleotidyltransferase family protein [Anaeromyxobacteraceae bacterium]|nr:nucleotidyltransferase family protein [Anaeromyxobacteraceae bacterium]
MPLLDAIRALCEIDPPHRLPPCDLGELADVLVAHGLAPMASYHVENRLVGAGLPDAFRERLLTVYQGVVNDNLYRVLSLRSVLREAAGVPAVLLDGAAYADWLYPHLAFRPLGDLRLSVRGEDGARFAEAASRAGFALEETGPGGRTATFGDGKIRLAIQEGLWPGAAADPGLFERARPHPAFGKSVARPAPEDALVGAVAGQALLGLYAPLHTFVDLRQLLRLEPGLDVALVARRAQVLGLERALYGSMTLLAHFFPDVGERARSLRPALGAAERMAVEAVVESARDPVRLRHLRGAEAAARAVVAPRA